MPSLGPFGLPEMIIVLIVAALVLGPKRLPGVGRRAGETLRAGRKAKDEMQDALSLGTTEQARPYERREDTPR
jgi:sec-independent protein translocase protein TatA